MASTSNGWSFTYDNNGNMQTGRGATINWTSYNLPSSITNGSISSTFSYTPDRRYWQQVAQYAGGPETTIYVGGLMEKVVGASGTDYHHMIRAGSSLIVVSRSTGSNNETYFISQDSLGSSSVVTNTADAVTVNQSFAAYGARRGTNWTGTPTGGDYTAIANSARRGYTGHTELDNLGLIHMNGRMYDPAIGRFASADPFVPHANSSQSFNRLSYVENAVLTQTDPSGFVSDATKPYNPNWRSAFTRGFMTIYVPHGTTVTFTNQTEINVTPDLSNGIQLPPSIHVSVEHGSFNSITGGGWRVTGRPSFELVARSGREPAGDVDKSTNTAQGGTTPQGGQQNPTQCPKKSASSGYWSRVGGNWWDTNKGVPGLLAPTGLGVLTAGKTSEFWLGTNQATIGRWVFSGFKPITLGPSVFTTAESGILVGASAIMNFALVGISYEGGVLGGSMISAIPNGSGGSVRDSLATGLYDLFGPESKAEELACGW